MKKSFLVFITFLFFITAVFIERVYSQKPEKVYSIVKTIKPFEWYKAQAKLWKQEIDKNSKNREAWLYYYTANRMARLMDHDNWNNNKGDFFKDLNEIVKMAEKAIPETFESVYIKCYNNSSWDEEGFKILFKAYKLGPDRNELLDELTSYYEVKRDIENRNKICKRWFDSNELSSGILNFNYNVLASMENNGIIITNGDNDTYPIWILQGALGIKKDVYVINISMITIDEYRTKIFQEIGIPNWSVDANEIKNEKLPGEFIKKKIMKHIIEHSKRPVYLALTLSQEYYPDIKNKLYIIGLAFRYSFNDIDNIALLRKSYEKNFLVDYLKMNFYNDISASVVKQMNISYLAGFMRLYEHYAAADENDKANAIKNLIINVSRDTEKEEDIKNWLNLIKDVNE
jgi:hypothetical protein